MDKEEKETGREDWRWNLKKYISFGDWIEEKKLVRVNKGGGEEVY